jgi:hypothetical protein
MGDASVVGDSHQRDASGSNEWFPHLGDASVPTLPNTTPTPTRSGTLGISNEVCITCCTCCDCIAA